MSICFHIKYLCAFLVIFVIEALIAICLKDGFIRYSVGDVLVVVLIYCFIKSLIKTETKLLPQYIFIFAALVEVGQYFRLVDLLGMGDIRLARVVLGTTFDIRDIACYLAGCIGIWIFERLVTKASVRKKTPSPRL